MPALLVVAVRTPGELAARALVLILQVLLFVGVWSALLAVFRARTLPLFRALKRARAVSHGEQTVPPSAAAVRDAYTWPIGAWLCAGAGALVPLVDLGLLLASNAPLAGVSPAFTRLLWDICLAAACATCAPPLMSASARIIWSWLRHVHAAHVPETGHPSAAVWLAAGAGLPLAWLAANAALVIHAASGTLSWPAAAVPIGTLLGAGVATAMACGFGRRASGDLSLLAAHVREIGRDQGKAASIRGRLGTQEARTLVDAVDGLAQRFASLTQEQRQAQQAVQQAQRLKARFVASMSHDLRSPLNSILGFAELMVLGADGPLTSKQRDSVRTIQRSAGDLLRLLDETLDWARLEAGRIDLRLEWIPAVEILTEAARQAGELAVRRDLQIRAELQPGLPPLYVDSERVVKAVMGLFGHAMRAMDRGVIRLRARVAQGPPGPVRQVRVDVVDASAGIRQQDRARIFEAFQEIAEPSGRRIGGLGLGLAVARGLVQAHGGDAWCETRAGAGTTLTVALPVRERGRSHARSASKLATRCASEI
ncbi:MAG: HAMP domain-containing histidine kinase [Proteobacteria bacterium]|nr:HAMP domain-containing histidine kinase [Pseudomonadota bacterium]